MLKKISVLTVVLVMLASAFSVAAFADEPLIISPAPDAVVDSVFDTAPIPDAVVDPALDIAPAPETSDSEINNAEDVSTGEKKVQFKPMAFVENLNIMGVGMLGIFIVIGAIIVSVVVLNKLTAPKPEKKDE